MVEHARNSYNIHESFNLEGYFSTKVTLLGENLFLLEDKEEGELAKLMELGASLLMQWFEEIKRWEPSDVDQERVTWFRIYGIPCHDGTLTFSTSC